MTKLMVVMMMMSRTKGVKQDTGTGTMMRIMMMTEMRTGGTRPLSLRLDLASSCAM